MQHTFGAAERINHEAPMLASVPDTFSRGQTTGDGQIHETMARIADIIVESDGGPHEQLVDTIISKLGVSRVLRRGLPGQHKRKAEL